jgi:hypothetical protein
MDNSQEVDLDEKSESDVCDVMDKQILMDKTETVSESYNHNQTQTQTQLQWTDRQISNLEREMLLNNNKATDSNFISNWTKVLLSALAVAIPGIGQIIGVILGLVFISDDGNVDKRSYGAALITVSIVAFIISGFLWFVFALMFGPQIFY